MFKDDGTSSRVLLNCMPPAHTLMPSAALNILKSVLKQNGFSSEINYWNVTFEPLLTDWAKYLGKDNYEIARLLPFIYLKALEYNDKRPFDKIKSILLSTIKDEKDLKKKAKQEQFLLKLPERTIKKINQIIHDDIARFNFDGVILSGFSAKFYQWLAALPVAVETKKVHPEIKTIIGGFESKDVAFEMMRNFDCFDFAIWGEGEYPLLELSNAIKNDTGTFSEIPALVYRDKNNIIVSNKRGRKYFDLNNYPMPDHDDFFSKVTEDAEKGKFIFYPVETIRGCNWNKCKFCVLANGYRYRERNVDSVIDEIKSAVKKYNVGYFQFLDNNIIGRDRKRFDYLLDQLIKFYIESEDDFNIFCEIIPHNLDASTYRKIALAGFRMAQVGGESLADPLIKKMNKMNSFSDNLLAYKCCLKYGIHSNGANIITGIPGETAEDVKTCINNIPYLRFILSNRKMVFNQNKFELEKLSKFYGELSDAEKEKYTEHFIYNLLPEAMKSKMNRYELFFFRKNKIPHQKLWDKFFKQLESYYKSNISYRIFKLGDLILFEEFNDKIKTISIIFDHPEQWQILVNANECLVSFDELICLLQREYKDLNTERVKKMMDELKSKQILYFDEDYNKIVSVIDTELML